MVIDIYQFKIHGQPKNNNPISFPPIIDADSEHILETSTNNRAEVSTKTNERFCKDVIASGTLQNGGTYITNLHDIYINNQAKARMDKNFKDKYYTTEYIDMLYNNICLAADSGRELLRNNVGELPKTSTQKLHDGGFLLNLIEVNDSTQYVVFGDIHGSFHTFFRSVIRMYKMGIITDLNSLILEDNYKLVFLGDIVDRGQYALEVIEVIIKLIINNNIDPNNPKVIANRGNHEHFTIYKLYGFMTEIEYKCKHVTPKRYSELLNSIFEFFTYLPTCTVLNMLGKRIWFSHGGIPCYDTDGGTAMRLNIEVSKYIDEGLSKQIRWNDFAFNKDTTRPTTINNLRKCNKSQHAPCSVVHQAYFYEFMDRHKIDMIVRGHQDNYFNSYLVNNSPKGKLNICELDQNSDTISLNPHVVNEVYTIGPVASLVVDSNTWIPSRENVAPILVLATNTDIDRYLSNDSFAIVSNRENIDNFDNFSDLYKNTNRLELLFNKSVASAT